MRTVASLAGRRPDAKALKRRFDQKWPAFERRLEKAVQSGNSLVGAWKYHCSPYGAGDGDLSGWGGTCEIVEEDNWEGRVGLKILGERHWELMRRRSRETLKMVQPPRIWSSKWMAMTGERSVKYTYSIATEGNIEGFAEGEILSVKGRPQRIVGKFYQLSPFRPAHGGMELKRRGPKDKGVLW